ncbi:MAG TPA: NAD(P)H-dependent oxidoreductase subunit E, partial [Clostridia bacterium]|nr:NAD(P)H-dependent oxidoreductase subunit E [Clostridia bacterium]
VIMIIQVCIGSACHLKGAYNVINSLQKLIDEKKLQGRVTLKAAFCLGQCTDAVSVKIDDEPVLSVCDSNVAQFFDEYVLGRL